MNLSLPLLLAIIGCLCSCASVQTKQPKKEEKKAETGPALVGRIANIPADKRFVLIQAYGEWEPETGQILTTQGPQERTANLRVTGEKLGEFSAADLQSGSVERGDAVYSHHVVKPAGVLTTPEVPQSQGTTAEGKFPKNN